MSYSIHELAHILGPEITETELVPIIKMFLKDYMSKLNAFFNLS